MLTALIFATLSVLYICVLTLSTVVLLPLICIDCENQEKHHDNDNTEHA